MDKRPTISVAIPTHGMDNRVAFFKRCLDSLWNQTFQDFEIVVTDNSDDHVIEEICDFYRHIRYFRNPHKGMAKNTNEAIRRSQGELIKILYMDDFLSHDLALENIVKEFNGQWLVTACEHIGGLDGDRFNTHFPTYNEDMHLGNNTIGSPSVLTIKNDNPMLFDERLSWLLDGVYYKLMYDKYGEPIFSHDIGVIIGLHSGQMTHIMSDARKKRELEYVEQNYV